MSRDELVEKMLDACAGNHQWPGRHEMRMGMSAALDVAAGEMRSRIIVEGRIYGGILGGWDAFCWQDYQT